MYGMEVTIDGRTIFVMCCPDTPRSEVLLRASRQLAREEEQERLCSPLHRIYCEALD